MPVCMTGLQSVQFISDKTLRAKCIMAVAYIAAKRCYVNRDNAGAISASVSVLSDR